jgi:hypothetical protein
MLIAGILLFAGGPRHRWREHPGELLAYGRDGWMLNVRPTAVDWRSGLVTGSSVGPTIERWIAGGPYKERTS